MKQRCRSEQEEKLVQIGEPATSTYWKSLEERRNGPHFTAEFPGGLPQLNGAGAGEPTRRGFLGMMGFSLAAVGSTFGGIGRHHSRCCQLLCDYMPGLRLFVQLGGQATGWKAH